MILSSIDETHTIANQKVCAHFTALWLHGQVHIHLDDLIELQPIDEVYPTLDFVDDLDLQLRMTDVCLHEKVMARYIKRNTDPLKNALRKVDGALMGDVTGFKAAFLKSIKHGICEWDEAHQESRGIKFDYRPDVNPFMAQHLETLRESTVWLTDSPNRLMAFRLCKGKQAPRSWVQLSLAQVGGQASKNLGLERPP